MSRLAALLDRFRRGPDAGTHAALLETEDALTRRNLAIEERLDRISTRMEEIVAYFAQRSHPIHFQQPTYLGDHTALVMLHGRHPFFVDTRGIDIAPHLILFGVWETAYVLLFQRLIRPGELVLDIGANHGVYAVLGAAAGGIVAACEPNPRLCDLMRRSAAVNGMTDRLTVHEAAVGEADGTVQIAFDMSWPGGGHVLEPEWKRAGTDCRVLALDNLFPDPRTKVGVIKMDVEGSEGRAIRGMRQLLERSPDVRMMMEFVPTMLTSHGVGPAETIGMLREMGFRFWDIAADAALSPLDPDVLAAATDGSVRNILVARQEP
ncbi:MAG TPA: FkbM family methyltransferase [Roseomonas sp.]|jgi:FkbM family methyltransferase